MIDNKDKINNHPQAGFTLVELLVVLVIIGLIAALATPQVLRYLGQAKVNAASAQIRNFESILELCFIDNGAFPTTQQSLSALVEKPTNATRWNGPYLKIKGEINDPWGNKYSYKLNSENQPEIISFGQDGKVGGENLAADITN
ncbi:MAG: type II secretion system major pseudopilin GspG [Rhodobacteraceae bacterium]|nr:type II secretion system major pseudopilin GspG [Paracoccaceae bacterium]